MKKLFTYLFISLSLLCFSQNIKVTGLIRDEQHLTSIHSALIICCDNLKTQSDSSGRFTMYVEAGKKIDLKIKLHGFKTQHLSFFASRDTIVDVFMASTEIVLDEITVHAGKDNTFGVSRLNNVEGTTIFAGKKSEAVYVQDLNANLAANNSRQVFSKIPGINVFENDGTGVAIGIGGRGLNPNRISNFNTRQNGYDISADALGYPESYYTPPTDAIERIEILRGAAGLQFGTQFGGMINYKFSEASTKKIAGDFRQTSGSYGFINSFNKLSGTVGKISYTTFYQYKHYDGWRKRSELNSHNAFASIKYQVNDRIWMKVEYTYLNYLTQQPGGLLDKQFNQDPSQVTRLRNWFRVKWNLVSFQADYKISERTRVNLNSFALYAGRDALGVLNRPERYDNPSDNRNLLSDVYKNYGAELRLLHRYTFLKNNNHFLIGGRYYHGETKRKQGAADTTDLPHFNYLHPDNLENSSYTFPSHNYAVFAENIFQLTRKWSVTPGIRYEIISTASEGYYNTANTDLSGDTLPNGAQTIYDNRSKTRSFLLGGIGTQLKISDAMEFYANFSQNYRSINFNDMRIANPNSQVDPNLRDENGHTVDGGLRGSLKNLLYFDVGVFMLQYNDRIGTALKLDSSTFQIVRYRTNIGNSRNAGVEAFVELDWMKLVKKDSKHKLATFVNFSYINAVYISKDKAYDGKKVEYVPNMIFRTGLTYAYKKFGFTYQYSHTSEQYSDATNAKSSASSIYGIIPAYSVMDFSANYSWSKLTFIAGINNLANTSYFTRRAEGYPGPGIIPADRVNFYVTLKVKL